MSTQTIAGVAGAAIGFVATGGNPAGAQWGFMIGSMIGGAMTEGPHSSGPRLSDLAVQTATEGQPMPLDWGTVRHAGVVLWATDLRERATDSDMGGKGGPSATQTAYSYDVDLGVLITDGQIQGVRRIWANNRLIYDGRETADASAVMASSKLARQITFYLGTEDQLPDPTYEAAFGIGNCPAYRGKAYVVFKELQLGKFGNAIPSFSFEFVRVGAVTPYRRLALATLPQQFATGGVSGLGVPTIYSASDVVRVGVAGGIGGVTYVYDLDGNYLGTETRAPDENQWPIRQYGSHPDIFWAVGRLWNGDALYYRYYYGRTIGAEQTLVTGGAYQIHKDASGGLPAGRVLFTCCLSADGRYIFSVTAPAGSNVGSGKGDQWHITEWDGGRSRLVKEGAIELPFSGYEFGPGSTAVGHFSAGMMESNLEYLWNAYGAGTGSVTLYRIHPDGVMRVTRKFNGAGFDGIPTDSYPTIFADAGVCVTVIGNSLAVHTRIPSIAPATVPLSDVVADVCTRAGLAPAEIDTGLLTERVQGYTLGTQSSGRAALDPLRVWRPFDVAEQDGVLRFLPRGRAVDFEIPVSDLAARDAGTTLPDVVTITTADETELPSAVWVVFPNVGADYQTGAATARRDRRQVAGQAWPIVQQRQVSRIELPVVMSPADAARVADTVLWDAYTAARRVRFSVGLKWAAICPAHVVRIVTDSATYVLRVEKVTEAGLVREIDAVFSDPAAYISQPQGAVSVGYQSEALSLPGPTRLELLDLPLLRDTDDRPGYFAAVGRYLPGWPGATLYTSSDAGATWAPAQSFANSAIIGAAVDVLGQWVGGNTVDEANSVAVQVPAGLELVSISPGALLAGGNTALLGAELIQFRTATLVAAGRYRLTGLLRGRRGTESAIASHAAGERFVLLSGSVAGLAPLSASLADIGVGKLYRPVTAGAALAGAAEQSWSYQGNNLKPLSPVHINAGRDGAGNIAITWVRRTRVDGEWRDYADASLGESVERYEVELYLGGARVVTLASAQQSATWRIADQRSANAGMPVFTFGVKVWQISSSVGRGSAGSTGIALPPALIMLPDAPTGDATLPAGYVRKATIAHYSAVASAGATPIAMVVDGTVPPKIRYFGSTNGGQTWSQIGADSTNAPVVTTTEEWITTLSDGTYVGFNNADRTVPGAVPKIYRGTATAVPVYTGAGLLGGGWPHSITSDGLNAYIITESARVWKSTDKGTSWVDLGPLGGEFSQLVNASGSVTARLRLHRAAAGWLLESISMYGDQFNGAATQKAILSTTQAEPVDGWIVCLDLRSGLAFADYHGRLGKIGSYFITRTEGAAPSGGGAWQSIIWVSSDSGQTWTSTVLPGQTYGGAYLSGLAGPYNLGGTPVYIEEGGSRYLTYSSGSWSVQTAYGRPAFATWRGVISLSTGGLIIPAWTEQGYSMWRTVNGMTWTIGTGITLD